MCQDELGTDASPSTFSRPVCQRTETWGARHVLTKRSRRRARAAARRTHRPQQQGSDPRQRQPASASAPPAGAPTPRPYQPRGRRGSPGRRPSSAAHRPSACPSQARPRSVAHAPAGQAFASTRHTHAKQLSKHLADLRRCDKVATATKDLCAAHVVAVDRMRQGRRHELLDGHRTSARGAASRAT